MPKFVEFTHYILGLHDVIADTSTTLTAFNQKHFNRLLNAAGRTERLSKADITTLAAQGAIEEQHSFLLQKLELTGSIDSQAFIDKWHQDRKTLFETNPPALADGLMDFLATYKGVYALATNADRASVERDLQQLGLLDWFSGHIHCHEHGLHKKPEPDIVSSAARALDAPWQTTVYIGSDTIDMKAALAAGISPIGFLVNGMQNYDKVSELSAAGAIHTTDTFARLSPGEQYSAKGWGYAPDAF